MREVVIGHTQTHQTNKNTRNSYPVSIQMESPPTSKSCAWCGAVMAESYEGGGHGICYACYTKVINQAQNEGYIGNE